MSNTSAPTGGRYIRLALIVLILVAVLAFKPAKIAYHRSAMRKAWAETIQSTNGQGLMDFQIHRTALVSLGYYSQKTFPLKNIRAASPEERSLEKELLGLAAKGIGIFALQGAETNVLPEVTVWAKADDLPEWTSLINARNSVKPK